MVEPSGKLNLIPKRNRDGKQDVLKYKPYSRDADPLLLAKASHDGPFCLD